MISAAAGLPVAVGTAVAEVGSLPQRATATHSDVKALGSNQLNAALVSPMK